MRENIPKEIYLNIYMTEMITQKCNKCKKELSINDFGINWNGVFFKHCNTCRERNRLEQARAALRKKAVISNVISTPEITEKVDIIKDVEDDDQLKDSSILTKSNKNQFVHHIIQHIKAADPDCKISFEKPPNDVSIKLVLYSRIVLIIKYGCSWIDLKKNMRSDLEELREQSTIKDETVFEESNLHLFLEKIQNCIGSESISVEHHIDEDDNIMAVALKLETRKHMIMIHIGDKWKRVKKFLEINVNSVYTCPICLDECNYNTGKRIIGCAECNVTVCADCSINQFIANQGVVVCCNCRHTVGEHIPAYLVKEAARLIRLEYGI